MAPFQNITETFLFAKERFSKIYPKEESASLAYLILDHFIGFTRSDVITRGKESIPKMMYSEIKDAIEKVENGNPIQYVLGKAHFYGMELVVDENVLIPRQETEELVAWVLKDNYLQNPKVIDLCSGSGCIALAIKKHIPGALVSGMDISGGALEICRQNAMLQQLEIDFFSGDVLSGLLPLSVYDIIISNPPYIDPSESGGVGINVLGYEPDLALFSPPGNALAFYIAIAKHAKNHLNSGGALYVEIDERRGAEVVSLFEMEGFVNVEIRKDLNGKNRMVKGVKP